VCYCLWKITEGIKDTRHKGTNAKGIVQRAAYVFSGLIYGSLAWVSFKIIVGKAQQSGGEDNQEMITSQLLDLSYGEWLVSLIGVITIGNGLYQISKGLKKSFMKEVSGLSFN